MSEKKPDSTALDAAKAVMKRMLQTPPEPHEVKGDGKRRIEKKKRAKS